MTMFADSCPARAPDLAVGFHPKSLCGLFESFLWLFFVLISFLFDPLCTAPVAWEHYHLVQDWDTIRTILGILDYFQSQSLCHKLLALSIVPKGQALFVVLWVAAEGLQVLEFVHLCSTAKEDQRHRFRWTTQHQSSFSTTGKENLVNLEINLKPVAHIVAHLNLTS